VDFDEKSTSEKRGGSKKIPWSKKKEEGELRKILHRPGVEKSAYGARGKEGRKRLLKRRTRREWEVNSSLAEKDNKRYHLLMQRESSVTSRLKIDIKQKTLLEKCFTFLLKEDLAKACVIKLLSKR